MKLQSELPLSNFLSRIELYGGFSHQQKNIREITSTDVNYLFPS